MPNPAYVAAGPSAGGTSTSREVETPTGTEVGHLLLAEIMVDAAEVTPTMAGWEKISQAHSTSGETQTSAWFWKIATEAGAKKHKVEWGGASRYNAGMVGVFKNVNSAEPIAAFATKICEPKSVSMVFASIAPSMANSISVLFGGIDNSGTGTAPEGWTERQDNTVGNYLATKAEIGAGATGEKTVTMTAERVYVTIHIALASEAKTVEGSAAGTGVGSGTAEGTRTRLGTAEGTGTGSGTASGVRESFGIAAGTGIGSGEASGTRTRFGIAEGTGVGSGTAEGTVEGPPPPEGLVSRWLLEETSGTVAADSVGENDGTYEGTAILGEDSIVPAYPASHSVALREFGDYISIPDDPSLRFTTAYTIKAWYEWDGSDNGFLLVKGDEDYAVYLNADGSLTALFRYEASKWREVSTAAAAVPKDEPCCIHVTYDKSNLRIFVNGAEVKSAAFTDAVKTSTNGLALGRQQSAESAFLHGRYQRVDLYGSALTPTQVEEDFDADNKKELPPWEDFNGDLETGDFSQYLETQAPEGRATIVASPVAQGKYAARFEGQEGDPEVAGGHRAEMIPDREFGSGDSLYFRDLINLYQIDWNHWTIIAQWHDTSKGSPPLCAMLVKEEGSKRLRIQKGDSSGIYFDLAAPAGPWFELIVHPVFEVEGSVEVWINGESQGIVTGIDPLGIEPTNFKCGFYKSGESEGETLVYHDGVRISEAFFSEPPIPGAPTALTGKASGVSLTAATLNGTVDPNFVATTYFFEYGETEAYGTKVPAGEDGEAGEGSEPVAVSEVIEGLEPNATYHFRLVAVNAEGEDAGGDETFVARPHSRIAITREYPPDRLAVRIADPATGQTIARCAEDEPKAENIVSNLRKTGEMPGGHKEMTCVLARDPRVDYPDLAIYNDVYVEQPGGEDVWQGRLEKKPKSDGERLVIEPAAVGHQAALQDRKGIIGPGFIDCDQSKWGDPSTARRLQLIEAAIALVAATSQGFSSLDPEAVIPAIINDFTNVTTVSGKSEDGEAHYDSGGPDIGQILYDYRQLTSYSEDGDWESNLALGISDTSFDTKGSDHNRATHLQQSVTAPGPGYRRARLRDLYGGAFEGQLGDVTAWQNLKVLGNHSLTLQGTWPNVGFTSGQMLRYIIPLYTYLQATEESVEDSGYVIPHAWFSEPGMMAQVVQELTKYELLDYFVLHGKLFEQRVPGSYGRLWKAYAGPSELKETGEDGSRLWNKLMVAYQDVDGSTRTVGYPGSGANTESEALEITDPDHPAVKAGKTREDLLSLKGISTAERALEAGERFLADANELSHAGEATLRGYVMDDKSIFRPVAQVQPGDYIRFPDAADTSYRKIVLSDYDDLTKTCQVSMDAPPEDMQSLLERMQADLILLAL